MLLGAMDATNGVISDPVVVFSGFMDTMSINETGETAEIQITVENRLIEFGKRRIRRYTAEDQRSTTPTTRAWSSSLTCKEEIVWGRNIVGEGGGGVPTPPQPVDQQ